MDYIYLTDDFFLENDSFFWMLLVTSTVSILVTSIVSIIQILSDRMGSFHIRNIFIKKLDESETKISDLSKKVLWANERITKTEILAKELASKNQQLQEQLNHITKNFSNGKQHL